MEGFSIGLSICRRIVESCDGELFAYMHDKGSSTFQFSMKMKLPHMESSNDSLSILDIMNRKELEENNSIQIVGHEVRSQLIKEEDVDFESPFTKRNIFTQQRNDSESNLSVVFADIDAFKW